MRAFGRRRAVHQRQVRLLHLARLEGLLQRHQRLLVLGHDEAARGVLVQPVDDARAQLAAHARQVLHAVQQRVDQRAGRVARARVHDHARGLVDDDEVAVLVEHAQRQLLGLRDGGARARGCGRRAARRPAGAARPCAGLPSTCTWPSSISALERGSG